MHMQTHTHTHTHARACAPASAPAPARARSWSWAKAHAHAYAQDADADAGRDSDLDAPAARPHVQAQAPSAPLFNSRSAQLDPTLSSPVGPKEMPPIDILTAKGRLISLHLGMAMSMSQRFSPCIHEVGHDFIYVFGCPNARFPRLAASLRTVEQLERRGLGQLGRQTVCLSASSHDACWRQTHREEDISV